MKIYSDRSTITGAGRGVFAGRNIKKGEIVERCPIIEIPKNDTANLNETMLVTYFFYFGKNKERVALALGYGSLYNHSDNPNVEYKIRPKEMLIDFMAIKDIKKNSELTFDYHGGKRLEKNRKPLWFEV